MHPVARCFPFIRRMTKLNDGFVLRSSHSVAAAVDVSLYHCTHTHFWVSESRQKSYTTSEACSVWICVTFALPTKTQVGSCTLVQGVICKRFAIGKITWKVIVGHQKWPYSIGHITSCYLPEVLVCTSHHFRDYYHLFTVHNCLSPWTVLLQS